MPRHLILKAAVSLAGLAAFCFATPAESQARRLVILHTNDTHSTIDPEPGGTGGILQRKAVIDSVRRAERNVIVADAGDAVQGTLYFKYFRGEVEYPLFEMAGYDIRIPGNHEFDNGMTELARQWKDSKVTALASNYGVEGTELEGVLQPWTIKEADGKKVAFIALCVNPESLISEKNISVEYSDPVAVADSIARWLKTEKGADLVVALSHIGYDMGPDKPDDKDIVRNSRHIDAVIGGHTHTLVDPSHPEATPSVVKNADGRDIRVAQAGKNGRYLGKLSIDLDKVGRGKETPLFDYELIPVTDRFPTEKLDREMAERLEPYRQAVDSVNNHAVAWAAEDMENGRKGTLGNLTADFGLLYARQIADSLRRQGLEIPTPDLAIMNIGGIRHSIPQGPVTEGKILSTYPFSNRFTIVAIKGADLMEALRVAARKGGEAISHNVHVVTGPGLELIRVAIDGREMDPDRTYILGSIDYVAEGNDDLRTLANHTELWTDDREVAMPILDWFRSQGRLGVPVAPDPRPRFTLDVSGKIGR